MLGDGQPDDPADAGAVGCGANAVSDYSNPVLNVCDCPHAKGILSPINRYIKYRQLLI